MLKALPGIQLYVHVSYYYSSVQQRAAACWKAPFFSEMLLLVYNLQRVSKAWWHTGWAPEDRVYVETLANNVSCLWYQSSHLGLPSLCTLGYGPCKPPLDASFPAT